MGSILDDIDTIINDGDTHVVKTKLFERIVNHLSPYEKKHNTVIIDSYTINRKISDEIQTLKYCGVRDLYKYFYLNESEIRQLCSDKNTVREVQNNSYSFCIRGNRGEYYNGHFKVNLDNSLTLLAGGTIMIEMDDELFKKQLVLLDEASKDEKADIKTLVAEIVPTYKRKDSK